MCSSDLDAYFSNNTESEQEDNSQSSGDQPVASTSAQCLETPHVRTVRFLPDPSDSDDDGDSSVTTYSSEFTDYSSDSQRASDNPVDEDKTDKSDKEGSIVRVLEHINIPSDDDCVQLDDPDLVREFSGETSAPSTSAPSSSGSGGPPAK